MALEDHMIGNCPICQRPVRVDESNRQDGFNVWHRLCVPTQEKLDEYRAKWEDLRARMTGM